MPSCRLVAKQQPRPLSVVPETARYVQLNIDSMNLARLRLAQRLHELHQDATYEIRTIARSRVLQPIKSPAAGQKSCSSDDIHLVLGLYSGSAQ